MARIVTVYAARRGAADVPDMSAIWWLEISRALARRGHRVDMAVRGPPLRRARPTDLERRLRKVPLREARWRDYDVVKTLFHEGFETLERYGGTDHPFILSLLGSVVGPEEMEGIHFHGRARKRLFAVQRRIARKSRFVSVLSSPAVELWRHCFGNRGRILLVPGAAPEEIPSPSRDPYPDAGPVRCLFAGNFYTTRRTSQPEAHRVITRKLNGLGRLLAARDARLYVVGPGEERSLDPDHLTYLGAVDYNRSWDYLRSADVGTVVTAGKMHNNESTKIYHYLRVGLPTVTESGFPNEGLIPESGCGLIVPRGNMAELAEGVLRAAARDWDRQGAIDYILANHTWAQRSAIYDRVFSSELPG